MRTYKTIFSVALIAFAQPLSPACAAADDQPVRIVRYNDLDLSHADGQDALRRRTKAAIRAVCPEPDERDLGILAQHSECLAAARKGAQEQIAAAIDASLQLANASTPHSQIARR